MTSKFLSMEDKKQGYLLITAVCETCSEKAKNPTTEI